MGMFDNWSQNARRALFFSRYEAHTAGSDRIAPEHFLVGLVREGEIPVLRIFQRLKVNPKNLESAIRSDPSFRKGPPNQNPQGEIPLTEKAKRVLQASSSEAEELSHSQVTGEHLLMGLSKIEDTLAQQVLSNHGLDANTIRHALL